MRTTSKSLTRGYAVLLALLLAVVSVAQAKLFVRVDLDPSAEVPDQFLAQTFTFSADLTADALQQFRAGDKVTFTYTARPELPPAIDLLNERIPLSCSAPFTTTATTLTITLPTTVLVTSPVAVRCTNILTLRDTDTWAAVAALVHGTEAAVPIDVAPHAKLTTVNGFGEQSRVTFHPAFIRQAATVKVTVPQELALRPTETFFVELVGGFVPQAGAVCALSTEDSPANALPASEQIVVSDSGNLQLRYRASSTFKARDAFVLNCGPIETPALPITNGYTTMSYGSESFNVVSVDSIIATETNNADVTVGRATVGTTDGSFKLSAPTSYVLPGETVTIDLRSDGFYVASFSAASRCSFGSVSVASQPTADARAVFTFIAADKLDFDEITCSGLVVDGAGALSQPMAFNVIFAVANSGTEVIRVVSTPSATLFEAALVLPPAPASRVSVDRATRRLVLTVGVAAYAVTAFRDLSAGSVKVAVTSASPLFSSAFHSQPTECTLEQTGETITVDSVEPVEFEFVESLSYFARLPAADTEVTLVCQIPTALVSEISSGAFTAAVSVGIDGTSDFQTISVSAGVVDPVPALEFADAVISVFTPYPGVKSSISINMAQTTEDLSNVALLFRFSPATPFVATFPANSVAANLYVDADELPLTVDVDFDAPINTLRVILGNTVIPANSRIRIVLASMVVSRVHLAAAALPYSIESLGAQRYTVARGVARLPAITPATGSFVISTPELLKTPETYLLAPSGVFTDANANIETKFVLRSSIALGRGFKLAAFAPTDAVMFTIAPNNVLLEPSLELKVDVPANTDVVFTATLVPKLGTVGPAAVSLTLANVPVVNGVASLTVDGRLLTAAVREYVDIKEHTNYLAVDHQQPFVYSLGKLALFGGVEDDSEVTVTLAFRDTRIELASDFSCRFAIPHPEAFSADAETIVSVPTTVEGTVITSRIPAKAYFEAQTGPTSDAAQIRCSNISIAAPFSAAWGMRDLANVTVTAGDVTYTSPTMTFANLRTFKSTSGAATMTFGFYAFQRNFDIANLTRYIPGSISIMAIISNGAISYENRGITQLLPMDKITASLKYAGQNPVGLCAESSSKARMYVGDVELARVVYTQMPNELLFEGYPSVAIPIAGRKVTVRLEGLTPTDTIISVAQLSVRRPLYANARALTSYGGSNADLKVIVSKSTAEVRTLNVAPEKAIGVSLAPGPPGSNTVFVSLTNLLFPVKIGGADQEFGVELTNAFKNYKVADANEPTKCVFNGDSSSPASGVAQIINDWFMIKLTATANPVRTAVIGASGPMGAVPTWECSNIAPPVDRLFQQFTSATAKLVRCSNGEMECATVATKTEYVSLPAMGVLNAVGVPELGARSRAVIPANITAGSDFGLISLVVSPVPADIPAGGFFRASFGTGWAISTAALRCSASLKSSNADAAEIAVRGVSSPYPDADTYAKAKTWGQVKHEDARWVELVFPTAIPATEGTLYLFCQGVKVPKQADTDDEFFQSTRFTLQVYDNKHRPLMQSGWAMVPRIIATAAIARVTTQTFTVARATPFTDGELATVEAAIASSLSVPAANVHVVRQSLSLRAAPWAAEDPLATHGSESVNLGASAGAGETSAAAAPAAAVSAALQVTFTVAAPENQIAEDLHREIGTIEKQAAVSAALARSINAPVLQLSPLAVSSVSAECANGVQDGSETGIDCGGPSCPACATGAPCSINSDCRSGSCRDGACVNSNAATAATAGATALALLAAVLTALMF